MLLLCHLSACVRAHYGVVSCVRVGGGSEIKERQPNAQERAGKVVGRWWRWLLWQLLLVLVAVFA